MYTELFVHAIYDRDGKTLTNRVGREVTTPIGLKSQHLVLEELRKLTMSVISIRQTLHCCGTGGGSQRAALVYIFNCCNGLGIVIRVLLKTKRELSRNTAWELPLTLAAKCVAYLRGFRWWNRVFA